MRRAAAALCLIAVTLAGCGGGGDSDKDRVEAYIDDANKITKTASPRFAAANEAFKKFTEGDLKGKKAGKELRGVELDIAAVRNELAELQPPPKARRLHELLLRAYELNVLMAAEARQMAGYTPRAQEALKRIPGIQRRLRRGLDASQEPARQISTLRRYASGLESVRARLRELEVPAALAADRETQLRLLGRARALGLQLAAAIKREDADAVNRLLERFRAGGDPQPELQKLTKGSIAAYRQRLVTIDRAAAEVREERARLARDLL